MSATMRCRNIITRSVRMRAKAIGRANQSSILSCMGSPFKRGRLLRCLSQCVSNTRMVCPIAARRYRNYLRSYNRKRAERTGGVVQRYRCVHVILVPTCPVVSHLPDNDPDDPETTGDEEHQTIADERPKVVLTSFGEYIRFLSHFDSFQRFN